MYAIGLILGTGKWSAFIYGIGRLDMRSCKGIYGETFYSLACGENNLQDFTWSFIGACWWLLKIRWQQMIPFYPLCLTCLQGRGGGGVGGGVSRGWWWKIEGKLECAFSSLSPPPPSAIINRKIFLKDPLMASPNAKPDIFLADGLLREGILCPPSMPAGSPVCCSC